ncbi:hypothetical protein IAU60_001218 [Kwoniella sp. DSM 27419]
MSHEEIDKAGLKDRDTHRVTEVAMGAPPPVATLDKHAFGFWSVFSLAFSCINSWVVLILGLTAGLTSGGPTAMFPTAGGQYHWAAMLSPPRSRAAISWATGMLNVIGLWLGIATAAYLCANMVVSIILVNNPDYVNTPAKQYAIFIAMTLFAPLSALGVGSK